MTTIRWRVLWQVLCRYHLIDYLLCLLFWLCERCVSKYITPYCRSFSWDDPSISYPHIKNDDATWLSLSVIKATPIVVFIWGEVIEPLLVLYFTEHDGWSETEYEEVDNEETLHNKRTTRSVELTAQLDERSTGVNANDVVVITVMTENDNDDDDNSCSIGNSRNIVNSNNSNVVSSMSREEREEQNSAICRTSIIDYVNNNTNNSNSEVNNKRSNGVDDNSTENSNKQRLNTSGMLHSVHVEINGSNTEHRSNEAQERAFILTRLVNAHYWILSYLLALTLAVLLKSIMKVYAGRLRPDFLTRLRKEGYRRRDRKNLSIDWCKVGLKSRVSFPSGHSTSAFACFTPICFYVAHCIKLCKRNKRDVLFSPYIKLIIVLLPLVVPTMVAISRTRDYRHNFDDILAGTCIGVACSFFSYFVYFRINTITGRFVLINTKLNRRANEHDTYSGAHIDT